MARRTVPGPEMPTLSASAGSLGPWKAPATNGLSPTALQKATNLAQAIESRSAEARDMPRMACATSSTASALMPARVEPQATDPQTRAVVLSASGRDAMSAASPGVVPFSTRAEKPAR